MSEDKKMKNFEVFVDDNYHYMDEDERYSAGEFDNYEEALACCRKIVDDYLLQNYKPGMNAEELYDLYLHFGEDPFVRCNETLNESDKAILDKYSSWNYAKKRSIDICNSWSVTGMIDKLLEAINFAAYKHKDQRRKGVNAEPYINHPLAVAKLLTDVAIVYDLDILQAAILHDTIEDTETSREELLMKFGKAVTDYVIELTDDKSLPKAERKQLQIVNAPHKSKGAKLIKLCDKICNITDVMNEPPTHWNIDRRKEYFDWAEQVVKALDCDNFSLNRLFEKRISEARDKLGEYLIA